MVYANAIARTEIRRMVRMGRNPLRQQMDCVDRADKVRFYSFQNSDLHVPFQIPGLPGIPHSRSTPAVTDCLHGSISGCQAFRRIIYV